MSVYSRKYDNVGFKASEKGSPLLESRWALLAFVLASLFLVSLTQWDALVNLFDRWAYEDEYGYGFLATALVPVLLWTRWPLVKVLANDTKWPGLALVVIAQFFGVLGALGESYFVEQIAFVLTLLGLATVIFGAGTFRIFAPLAVLLLLTIPLPYTLQAILTVKLQLLSTNIGVAAIRLIGIPVFVEGNIIDLGQYRLEVAEACSGLRYLLPLTCISFLLAYLYKAPIWKRAIIFASAAPITVLINSFRIAVIAVLVDNFGRQMADGFLHQFEGWVVFLLGALLLVLEILALEGFRLTNVKIASILERPPTVPGAVVKPISLSRAALVAGLVCAAGFGVVTSVSLAHGFAPVPVRDNFASFPRQIGAWSGKEGQLDPAVVQILKATDYYVGDFSEGPKGAPVDLFVAYYDSLSKGAAIHSPRVCLPGSGWEFASFQEMHFQELQPGKSGTFNRTIIQKGDQKILMYYWFQQRERRTADEFRMKYYLLIDSLFKNRKDGGLMRIYTPIAPNSTGVAEADDRLRAFARAALPTLQSYFPQ